MQLSRLYGVASGVIYRWIYRYSSLNEKGCRIIEMKQSSQLYATNASGRNPEADNFKRGMNN